MANFQAIRVHEEMSARIAMKQAAKARRKAKQQAMLTRIGQLKRECICRLYCRGEFIISYNLYEDSKSDCEVVRK